MGDGLPDTPESDNDSGGHYGGGTGDSSSSVKEQERFLPIANVSRIMKKSLPGNAKISKDAKEAVQECVSEFISFITGEASDKCLREKRKTINGDDLLWGMATLGFEDYIEPLKCYLNKYREMEGERISMGKGEQSATGGGSLSAFSGIELSGGLSSQIFHQQQQLPSYLQQQPASMRFALHQVPPYWMLPQHQQQQHSGSEQS